MENLDYAHCHPLRPEPSKRVASPPRYPRFFLERFEHCYPLVLYSRPVLPSGRRIAIDWRAELPPAPEGADDVTTVIVCRGEKSRAVEDVWTVDARAVTGLINRAHQDRDGLFMSAPFAEELAPGRTQREHVEDYYARTEAPFKVDLRSGRTAFEQRAEDLALEVVVSRDMLLAWLHARQSEQGTDRFRTLSHEAESARRVIESLRRLVMVDGSIFYDNGPRHLGLTSRPGMILQCLSADCATHGPEIHADVPLMLRTHLAQAADLACPGMTAERVYYDVMRAFRWRPDPADVGQQPLALARYPLSRLKPVINQEWKYWNLALRVSRIVGREWRFAVADRKAFALPVRGDMRDAAGLRVPGMPVGALFLSLRFHLWPRLLVAGLPLHMLLRCVHVRCSARRTAALRATPAIVPVVELCLQMPLGGPRLEMLLLRAMLHVHFCITRYDCDIRVLARPTRASLLTEDRLNRLEDSEFSERVMCNLVAWRIAALHLAMRLGHVSRHSPAKMSDLVTEFLGRPAILTPDEPGLARARNALATTSQIMSPMEGTRTTRAQQVLSIALDIYDLDLLGRAIAQHLRCCREGRAPGESALITLLLVLLDQTQETFVPRDLLRALPRVSSCNSAQAAKLDGPVEAAPLTIRHSTPGLTTLSLYVEAGVEDSAVRDICFGAAVRAGSVRGPPLKPVARGGEIRPLADTSFYPHSAVVLKTLVDLASGRLPLPAEVHEELETLGDIQCAPSDMTVTASLDPNAIRGGGEALSALREWLRGEGHAAEEAFCEYQLEGRRGLEAMPFEANMWRQACGCDDRSAPWVGGLLADATLQRAQAHFFGNTLDLFSVAENGPQPPLGTPGV